MHLCKGLLADVAGALLMELGAIVRSFGLRRLEPERCIHCGAALDAQPRRREHLPVMLLRGLALGASKRLRHLHQVVPLGFCDQAGERQQFAALFLREAGEVRAISLDRAQHAHAGTYIVVGEGPFGHWVRFHPGIVCQRRLRRVARICRCAAQDRMLEYDTIMYQSSWRRESADPAVRRRVRPQNVAGHKTRPQLIC